MEDHPTQQNWMLGASPLLLAREHQRLVRTYLDAGSVMAEAFPFDPQLAERGVLGVRHATLIRLRDLRKRIKTEYPKAPGLFRLPAELAVALGDSNALRATTHKIGDTCECGRSVIDVEPLDFLMEPNTREQMVRLDLIPESDGYLVICHAGNAADEETCCQVRVGDQFLRWWIQTYADEYRARRLLRKVPADDSGSEEAERRRRFAEKLYAHYSHVEHQVSCRLFGADFPSPSPWSWS